MSHKTSKKGFTLAETVLALAVVGLLMTTFMAVFLPSRKSIQGSLALQEADRVTSSLTTELSILRPNERQKYKTAFEKAFDWMQKTDIASRSILIYNYRGDLSRPERSDGSFQPYSGKQAVPGSNTMMTTAVILAEKDRMRFEEDIKAIVGPVFVVRMTQFVWDRRSDKRTTAAGGQQRYGETGGKYVLADAPGTISNPYSPGQRIATPQSFIYDYKSGTETPWGAEVLYMAEFFQLPVAQPNALKNVTYDKMKRPAFTRNLSFRR